MRLRSAQQTYAATKKTTKWECKACKGQKRAHSLIPGHCAKAPAPIAFGKAVLDAYIDCGAAPCEDELCEDMDCDMTDAADAMWELAELEMLLSFATSPVHGSGS